MKKIEKILDIVIDILLVVVVVCLVPILGSMVLGYTPTVVQSGSMEPLYYRGTAVFVKPCSFDDLEVEDIIVYQRGDEKIIHRVISIDEENRTVITKGDNNQGADPVVYEEQILDKAIFHIPYIGLVQTFFSSYKVPVLTVLVLLFGADIVFSIRGRRKENSIKEMDKKE